MSAVVNAVREWAGCGSGVSSTTTRRVTGATRRNEAGVRFVYFVQARGGGPVKIGMTSNVPRRLRQLQAASDEELVVRRTVRVHVSKARTMERNLHAHFDEARLDGEWFRPVPELAHLAHAIPEGENEIATS